MKMNFQNTSAAEISPNESDSKGRDTAKEQKILHCRKNMQLRKGTEPFNILEHSANKVGGKKRK